MEAEHIDKRVQQKLCPKLAAAPNHEMRLQRGEIGGSDSANASDRADVGQRVTAATNLHEMAKQLASRGAPFGRILENSGQRRVQFPADPATRFRSTRAPRRVLSGRSSSVRRACVRQHDGEADEGGGREQDPIERTHAACEKSCALRIPPRGGRVGRAHYMPLVFDESSSSRSSICVSPR